MRILVAALFATLVLLSPFATAQDVGKTNVLIEVGRPGDRAVPIALPVPKGASGKEQEMWEVVRRDLEISGWFKILDVNATLEPATAGVRPGEFSFADWQPSGAAVLAKTLTQADGANLAVEVFVYEVGGATKLGARRFTAPPTAARTLAHRVANEIIFLVTNERSFFDTRFAFSGKFGTNKEIYLVDADGYNRRSVTKNGSINLKPRWNHGGTALAFTSYLAGNPDLYIADLAKGQIRRVSHRTGINTGGAFSPGGALALTLTVGADSEIFTIDPNSGAEIARLTQSPGIDCAPIWSPDGSQIAFVSERSGGPQVYVMNANGSNPHRVTFSGGHNVDPSWSPKGDRIAFVGRDGAFDIFTVKTDGGGMDRITQGQGDNEDPSWSPEGTYLAFSSTRTGASHIWIASADGRHQVQITTGGGGYSNPNWSGHLSW